MKTATELAQKIADQELEAICLYMRDNSSYEVHVVIDALRAARRPSLLKSQALAVLENSAVCDHLSPEHAAILRHALEQLDD